MVGGAPVAVVRLGERLHALDGTCPHAGGPLGEGEVADGTLSCPLHGWAFDLATGRCATRADESVRVLPARARGGRVEVGASV
jgi:nitrite reductase (NADH) small subunit